MWDVMSDMGGLFESMRLISVLLIGILHHVTGSPMNKYIISNIFTAEKSKNEQA